MVNPSNASVLSIQLNPFLLFPLCTVFNVKSSLSNLRPFSEALSFSLFEVGYLLPHLFFIWDIILNWISELFLTLYISIHGFIFILIFPYYSWLFTLYFKDMLIISLLKNTNLFFDYFCWWDLRRRENGRSFAFRYD